MYNRPDFVGIGAMRSGSSWLHVNLRRHPDLYLPTIKELHYFDKIRHGRYNRELAQKQLNFVFKYHVKNRQITWRDMVWYSRYFLRPRSDRWYVDNFKPGAGRLSGEITPAYSILGDAEISAIQARWPHLKVVLLMRNPVDRAWSHVVKSLARSSNRHIGTIPMDAVAARLQEDNVLCRGDYVRIIDRWSGIFGPDQLFVGFFDQIVEAPFRLLHDICKFLGVDYRESYFVGETVAKQVNNTSRHKSAIPDELSLKLYEHYFPVIREINRRYGSYAESWEALANRVLKR